MQRLWVTLAWVAFALFDAAKTVGVMRSEGMHHNWPVLFVIDALFWLPWALASLLILSLTKPLRRLRSRIAMWGAHIAVGLAIAAVSSAWCTLLVFQFRPFGDLNPENAFANWSSGFYGNLPSTVVFYLCVLFLSALLESRERIAAHEVELARVNEQLAQATLSALRRQIEPHFLFNAINAIVALVREGRSDAAVQMLVNLSDFLRRTLSGTNRQEVPLSEELEFVQQYLAIQKARFAERLRLDIDITEAVRPAMVPSLILQPLVENAVNHGIAKRRDGGEVRIAASSRQERLHISIANDGPAHDSSGHDGGLGVGLSNVRTRLNALYGAEASFEMQLRERGGAEISISMPLRIAAT